MTDTQLTWALAVLVLTFGFVLISGLIAMRLRRRGDPGTRDYQLREGHWTDDL